MLYSYTHDFGNIRARKVYSIMIDSRSVGNMLSSHDTSSKSPRKFCSNLYIRECDRTRLLNIFGLVTISNVIEWSAYDTGIRWCFFTQTVTHFRQSTYISTINRKHMLGGYILGSTMSIIFLLGFQIGTIRVKGFPKLT